jgi:hypothetical protein
MTGGRRHRRRLRLPGACLVLLFAFYAGLAPGTMPAWMNGALTLVLCTGGETVTVTLDENGNPVERTHQRCDWSVQLLAADTAAPPLIRRHFPSPSEDYSHGFDRPDRHARA